METLLVTGGCGFIGSNFINYMLAKHNNLKIINIDILYYAGKETNVNENKNYILEKANISNIDKIREIYNKYNPDYVVHFAAQSHVDNSFDNSLQYTFDNVVGTHVMIQVAKEYGKLKKFIHFSTDEVYGEVDLNHPGCHEKSLLDPTNPYAATKAAAEFIVRSYYHSFKLPIIILRCNNVYGYNQYPEKLIPKFVNLLKDNQKLTIHGKGDTRRNFIWCDDVSSAVDIIIKNGQINEIYNIGTNQEYSVLEVASILLELVKPGEDIAKWIEFVGDRPFNDFRYAIDCNSLKSLGWREEHTDFIANLKKLL